MGNHDETQVMKDITIHQAMQHHTLNQVFVARTGVLKKVFIPELSFRFTLPSPEQAQLVKTEAPSSRRIADGY